jgi:MFS family permease
MDSSGAALGLILAAIVVYLLQREVVGLQFNTYQWLVILGIIPAFLALLAFIYVKEPQRQAAMNNACNPDQKMESTNVRFSGKFKIFLVIMFLFTLGNSSDAFLILRAQNLGNNVFFITLMLIVFNIVYALFSIPAGMLSDKIGRRNIIALGWGIYALVYLGFAVVNADWTVWLLWILYGLHYGLAEGVARAFVCDLVSEDQRGTAFGFYHGIVGFTLLPASLVAGWLWQSVGPSAPFYFGASMSVLAIVCMIVFIRE